MHSRSLYVLALLVLVPVAATAGPNVVVVDENNVTWGFFDEGGTPTSAFVMGPDTPPEGSGSANFQLSSGADGVAIGTLDHAALPLDEITTLTYATYQNLSPQAVALQFNIDYDDTDGDGTWQGRLVYEPSYTQTVSTGVWQTWDTLVATGSGNWWSTGTPIVGGAPGAQACTQADPCTWPEMLTAYPDSAIQADALGALLFKAGSGWPAGFDGNVDALRLVTSGGVDVVYDFETAVPVELQSFTIE